MATFIALLRGVNVSGHRPIAMADLRDVLETAGLANVRTYLRSGNVVFDVEAGEAAKHGDAAARAAALRERIASDLGQDVPVLVLSGNEVQQIALSNPFLSAPIEEKWLHVTFLFQQVSGEDFARLELPAVQGEDAALVGRAVYLRLPNGYGRTRLSNAFFEKALAMPATTRNWRTVRALASLSAEN